MQDDPGPVSGRLSRREFAAATTAAAALGAGSAAAAETASREVAIKTGDGTCDAVLTHPVGKGPWPAVLVWPDAYGLRPAMREMSARLAAQGFAVLTVNQFYRTRKAPIFEGVVDFADPATRGRLTELRAPLTQEAVMRDATTFVAWLDAQPEVNAKAKVGTVGYCMGGAMTMQSAAAVPARIGAGCSFHGGGLVTANPDSPHLLAPRIKASFYFGVARDDDAKAPDDKIKLKAALDAAKVPNEVVLYPDGDHGWCAIDTKKYAKEPADRAFDAMVALYRRALV
jgi:carboxymethylenebutenolidase